VPEWAREGPKSVVLIASLLSVRLLLVALVLLPVSPPALDGAASCGGAGVASASPMAATAVVAVGEGMAGMDVEVDLYSGRPNPHFHLDSATAGELMRRLAGLPPLPGPAATREGLGYRGLCITPDVTGPVAEIVVSGGVVVVRDRDGSTRFLADPGRALERWLVEAGTASLDPDVVSALRQDLAR
jgi:hypothetical protein